MNIGPPNARGKHDLTVVAEWLLPASLFFLIVFCWVSIGMFHFNGLSSPLFLALAAFCGALATKVKILVERKLLAVGFLWAAWIVAVDAISGDFTIALARDAHWLLLPIAVTLIAELVRWRPITARIFRLSIAFSIIAILAIYLHLAGYVEDWSRPPLFGNIRHFGMTLGFFVVFLTKQGNGHKYEDALISVARVLGLAMLLWSGSRAPVLGWVVAGIVFYSLENVKKNLKRFGVEFLIAVILAILLSPNDSNFVGVFTLLTRSARSASLDEVSSGRIVLWGKTIGALSEHHLWITGAGGNGFIRLGLSTAGPIFHPHNIFLQLISDWGIGGLALLLFVAKKSLIRAPITSNGVGVLALIGYVLVSGQFDGSTYHLEHLIYLSVGLGVFSAERPQDVLPRVNIKWLALTGIVVLSALHIYLINYQINWDAPPSGAVEQKM
jgi:hypothetical protein